jgi:glycosyltransferase involved in cell wall biosynthesis
MGKTKKAMGANTDKTVIMAEFSDVRYDARVLKSGKTISQMGFKVHLLMYDTSIKKNKTFSDGSIDYSVYSFKSRYGNNYGFNVFKKYFRALVILLKINFIILFSKADVYHAHNLKFLFSSFLASIIYNAKLVYDAHEIHSEHYDKNKLKGRFKNKINEFTEKIVLHRCAAFIQASDERAEFIAKKYKISKPYVLNNYVPYKEYKENNRIAQELNLKNHPILFYSGGIYLGGGRRLDNVIEAIKSIDNIYLVIVGFMNETVRQKLEALTSEKSLSEKVFVLPPVPQEILFEYASSADFGIIPLAGNSLNTKLSALNKMSEYLMAGLPVLASNYENLDRIINNNHIGCIGYTFDVLSPQSINNAIQKLKDSNEILQMRENSLKLAREVMNWENEARVINQIYNTIFTQTLSDATTHTTT